MPFSVRYPAIALLIMVERAVGGHSATSPAEPQARTVRPDSAVTRYRTATVDGIDIFYREAGVAEAVILLLHGFPTSSHMFRNLMPVLAPRYRVIAPDYPAFGQAARRTVARSYSFARFAELIDGLLSQLGVERYALYLQDYGAPVGYRLALRHPERITALVVQNGNAYEEGLKEFWNPIKAYWADGSDAHRQALRAGLTLAATKSSTSMGSAIRRGSHRTPGCTIRRCSTGLASTRSCSTCSRTTAATSRCIRSSRHSSARAGRRR